MQIFEDQHQADRRRDRLEDFTELAYHPLAGRAEDLALQDRMLLGPDERGKLNQPCGSVSGEKVEDRRAGQAQPVHYRCVTAWVEAELLPGEGPDAGDVDAQTLGRVDGGAEPDRVAEEVGGQVTVELGRTTMTVRDLLALSPGEVLELDRAAGSPADLLVNGRLIARGEVVVVDEDFGLRVTEIVDESTAG